MRNSRQDFPDSSLRAYPAGQAEPAPVRFGLAVYGGAFDPPHPGHESVVRRVLECAEQVLLVPSHRHAHGKRMVDFAVRCAWLSAWRRASTRRGYAATPSRRGWRPARRPCTATTSCRRWPRSTA